MTVLITMAGLGSRFRERGYLPPKFRIMARGRTLMDWSLMSLQAFFAERFIFACLDAEDAKWIRSTAAALGIAEIVVAKRAGVSRGQAETAFDALTHVDPNQPLWICNIDTCVRPNAMRPQDLGAAAGCVPVFRCSEPKMSFVRHGSGDDVTEIAEKRPISSWATVGLYGFRSAACFAEHYQEAYDHGRIRMVEGERYVAPIYELMLMNGERIVAPRLEDDAVTILGTPAQVLSFDPAALPPFGNTSVAATSPSTTDAL
jgi:NDP-sugar pyrophosphorylase family protein